jgi:hypothetical protein
MKSRRWIYATCTAFVIAIAGSVADDGQMFRRNVSKTPDLETEHAAISMMQLYVPAQTSSGELTSIDYYGADGSLVETRDDAKPLLVFYEDGEVEHVPDTGFVGHGKRDMFAAVSLDDGATWKRKNLSRSANRSSFTIGNGRNKVKYPGDVIRSFAAVAGDRVLVAWASRYCAVGNPGYTLEKEEVEALEEVYTDLPPLYLPTVEEESGEVLDLFGVAGSQRSSDFADEGYPEVGVVPYSCLWTARGALVQDPETELYEVAWTMAERLTSGVRDVNRVEVAAVDDVGFVVSWQEDPDGLRPGDGEGPGEGWSGATAHHGTDIWYSYVDWEHFDLVVAEDESTTPIAEYLDDSSPKVAVPMALPVRLTDNAMCTAPESDDEISYCAWDFDGNGADDFCESTVSFTNSGGVSMDLCQTEDGRVLRGNIGATRARVNLRGYDSDGDEVTDAAWVVLAYEESKGLGEGSDEEEEPIDIGKNIWYHSFDMRYPDLVSQGGMLNQPAVDPETGAFFELLTDDFGNEFYDTEIARRFSLISQSADKAGDSDVVAFAMWKQGIINQGGPADVMARRFVIPDSFDPTVENPFQYSNMVCEEWAYTDGSNPRYVQGLCIDHALNLSATNIVNCDNGTSGDACADTYPWDGGVTPFPKVTEWVQTEENLLQDSWTNPFEVAKGHRGFIDGDFIMVLYAWSPNQKANSVGHDNYNLYVRRSFDGGLSWTTTPADLGGDGTTTCEIYRAAEADGDDPVVCTDYGAGEFEQARNVSQLTGTKVTILDPRYSKTPGDIPTSDIYENPGYDDDIRDPSRFFIVYETGDNTTTAEGEPTPMNLFYSRATDWGDDYDLVEREVDGEVVEVFDWLENARDYHSGEASVTANPGGAFFYAVWNQWKEDDHGNVFDSDAWMRRVMYLDDSETTGDTPETEDPEPEPEEPENEPSGGGGDSGGGRGR